MSRSISHPSFSDGCKPAEGGFTLIEVLVAVSILAIILTSVYGIFSSVSMTRNRLDDDSADYHRARVIFDRLGKELRGAYFHARDDRLVFSGGVAANDSQNELELTTTAVSPLSRVGSGVALVRYRLVADPEADNDSLVLLRSEQPAYQTVTAADDADMMRLATGIEALSIRFSVDDQWRTTWDGDAAGSLPEMVEVVLSLAREEGPAVVFRSAFEIPRW